MNVAELEATTTDWLISGVGFLDLPFWSAPSRWPRAPSTFVYVGVALIEIGRVLFGKEWRGDEICAKIVPPPPAELLFVDPLAPRINLPPHLRMIAERYDEEMRVEGVKFDRLQHVSNVTAQLACDGKLSTWLRNVDTELADGDLFQAPDGLWNVESVVVHRLKAGYFVYQVKSDDKIEQRKVFPFFTRDSLDRALKSLSGADPAQEARPQISNAHNPAGGRPTRAAEGLDLHDERVRRGIALHPMNSEWRAIATILNERHPEHSPWVKWESLRDAYSRKKRTVIR